MCMPFVASRLRYIMMIISQRMMRYARQWSRQTLQLHPACKCQTCLDWSTQRKYAALCVQINRDSTYLVTRTSELKETKACIQAASLGRTNAMAAVMAAANRSVIWTNLPVASSYLTTWLRAVSTKQKMNAGAHMWCHDIWSASMPGYKLPHTTTRNELCAGFLWCELRKCNSSGWCGV